MAGNKAKMALIAGVTLLLVAGFIPVLASTMRCDVKTPPEAGKVAESHVSGGCSLLSTFL